MGNYFEQRCADGTFNCVPTVAAALAASNVGGIVSVTAVRCAASWEVVLLLNGVVCRVTGLRHKRPQ